MSGHSKWASIKYKKTITDQRRGRSFSKLVRAITVAAKKGGADPEANFNLRLACEKAKEANMPQETIKKAIDKAAGVDAADVFEETYEGLIPTRGGQGIGLIIRVLTDNKNRTLSEIKHVLERNSGKLGQKGAISYLFDQRGVVTIDNVENKKEEIELLAIDLGALDIKEEDDKLIIYTKPEKLNKIIAGLRDKEVDVSFFELASVAKTPLEIDSKEREKVKEVISVLSEIEDIEEIFTNLK